MLTFFMKTKLAVGLGIVAVFLCKDVWAQTPPAAASAPAASAPLLVDGAPLVKAWVPPAYPPELEKAGVQGRVTVHLIVDETGKAHGLKIGKSTDARFDQAALDSVSRWVFEAAVENRQPVAMGVSVRLDFKLPRTKPLLLPPTESLPKPLPKSEAKSSSSPDPEYPPALLARHLGGEVTVDFMVETDGRATGLRVIETSDPALVRPGLEAVKKLTFKPAMQGDLPVRAKMRSPMQFQPDVMQPGQAVTMQLEVNGFSLRLAEGQIYQELCESLPQIWSLPDPVFPRAAALAGQAGEAVLNFELTEQGFAKTIEVVSASSPEFGERLVDTLSAAVFKPAMKGGRTVSLPMQWKHVFAQPAAEAVENESSEARLIRLLRKGEVIASAKGLDTPLAPLWRVAPEAPAGAEAGAVFADVDVIIDQEGRVRLAHVAKASSEAYGRAALVAASQWVFEPPMRGGQAVDVRVRLPFR